MRELPILFSTDMVKAILDGRKTMTRRIIKPKTLEKFINLIWNPNENLCFSPYQPGDRLWVQETWKIDSLLRERPDYPMAIDFKAVQSGYSQAEVMCNFAPDRFEKFKKFYQKPGWQSPYFMPKEAARIWLEVTDVRVERLNEITEEDAIKEGLQNYYGSNAPYMTNISRFIDLWDSIYQNQGHGWEVNDWVWVYGLKRLEGYR